MNLGEYEQREQARRIVELETMLRNAFKKMGEIDRQNVHMRRQLFDARAILAKIAVERFERQFKLCRERRWWRAAAAGDWQSRETAEGILETLIHAARGWMKRNEQIP